MLGFFGGSKKRLRTDRKNPVGFARLQIDSLEERRMLAIMPEMVIDLAPGPGNGNYTDPTDVNGTLYFGNQASLWKTNGSSAGTSVVKDFSAEFGAAKNVDELVNLNGTLLFDYRYSDPSFHGNAGSLYRSDGTSAGTALLSTFAQSSPQNILKDLTTVGDSVYFLATDGFNGYNLYKSTGVSGGTSFVQGGFDFSGEPAELTNVNGTLYFRARTQTDGIELWKSDGTPSGTMIVRDINQTGPGFASPNSLVNVGGTLYFAANNGNEGTELWKSDGTCAGTVMVKDINPTAIFASSNPAQLTNVNGVLYFRADDGVGGSELWKSDGTSSGTVLVSDINPGATGSSLDLLTNVGGVLYFQANDGVHGVELWKSDGTSLGTVLVNDINPGATGSVPHALHNHLGTLYFSANNGTSGDELWTSDGTSSGTTMVGDINPGAASSDPQSLRTSGARLYFTAIDGTHGRELWSLINRVTLTGTPGDDSITVVFTSLTDYYVTLNGTSTGYTTGQGVSIDLDGLGGNDTLSLYMPTAGGNAVTFFPTGGSAGGTSYGIDIANVEYQYAFGGVHDTATLSDSAAIDVAYLFPNNGLIYDLTVSYFNQVVGVPRITANANVNTDYVIHIGSDGNDTFTSNSAQSVLTAPGGALNVANGFEVVFAFALGGVDSSVLAGLDGPASNTFCGTPGYSMLITPTTFIEPVGFDLVTANDGNSAGNAVFYDGAGDDTFEGNYEFGELLGPGYKITANGFRNAYAFASSGGNDTAIFRDGNFHDVLYVNSVYTTYTSANNSDFLLQAQGFDLIQIEPNFRTNGNDTAYITDGPGNDHLVTSGTLAEITYSDGSRVRVLDFDTVYAASVNGGVDTKAQVFPLNYDLFLSGQWAG